MGPMSANRAVALIALVAVLLGGAIGLSHVGQAQVIGPCNGRTWDVVIGHAPDTGDVAVFNTRAGKLVPTDCQSFQLDPNGGYFAVAQFTAQSDAQAWLDALVKAGWTAKYGFQPVLESTR